MRASHLVGASIYKRADDRVSNSGVCNAEATPGEVTMNRHEKVTPVHGTAAELETFQEVVPSEN